MKQTQEDKIISEFFKSLGPWREFVVVGGGFALFIYKLYLADPKLENLPVGTRDIDSLIPIIKDAQGSLWNLVCNHATGRFF